MGFERRKEPRYDVPADCRKYINLRIKSGNELVPALLGNFSRSGILLECPVAFGKGARTQCFLSISLVLSREISFGINVMYCYEDKERGSYLIGASIDSIADNQWFDVFVEVHDFIVLQGGVPRAEQQRMETRQTR